MPINKDNEKNRWSILISTQKTYYKKRTKKIFFDLSMNRNIAEQIRQLLMTNHLQLNQAQASTFFAEI